MSTNSSRLRYYLYKSKKLEKTLLLIKSFSALICLSLSAASFAGSSLEGSVVELNNQQAGKFEVKSDQYRDTRAERRRDIRGDRIDYRLDRKGDRINNRLDRRAERASANGHSKLANHLDARGNRIERRLDRKGDRINRRLDR